MSAHGLPLAPSSGGTQILRNSHSKKGWACLSPADHALCNNREYATILNGPQGGYGPFRVIVSSPEAAARLSIDAALAAAGWVLQDVSSINLYAGRGIAAREFPLKSGFGFAD